MARTLPWVFAGMVLLGLAGNGAFAAWWVSEKGRGFGVKKGKFWGGAEGVDLTELAYWTAVGVQTLNSGGWVGMLLSRGHSGGTGYRIW